MPPRRKQKEVGRPKIEEEEQDSEGEREMYQLQVARLREIIAAERAEKRTNKGSDDSSKGRPTSKTPSSTIQSGEYEAILKSPRAQKSRINQSKEMDKHRLTQAKEKERELLRKRLAELESEEEEDPGIGKLGSKDKKALLSRPLKKRKEWPNRGAERSWETSLKRQMKQAAARVLAADDAGI